MSDTANVLLLILVLLLVVGALRLDSLRQLWREWLRLGDKPASPAEAADAGHAHGPYVPGRPRPLHGDDPRLAQKPAFHRRGRRH